MKCYIFLLSVLSFTAGTATVKVGTLVICEESAAEVLESGRKEANISTADAVSLYLQTRYTTGNTIKEVNKKKHSPTHLSCIELLVKKPQIGESTTIVKISDKSTDINLILTNKGPNSDNSNRCEFACSGTIQMPESNSVSLESGTSYAGVFKPDESQSSNSLKNLLVEFRFYDNNREVLPSQTKLVVVPKSKEEDTPKWRNILRCCHPKKS